MAFTRLKFIFLHVKVHVIIRANVVTPPCQRLVFSMYLIALSPPDSHLICSRYQDQGGGGITSLIFRNMYVQPKACYYFIGQNFVSWLLVTAKEAGKYHFYSAQPHSWLNTRSSSRSWREGMLGVNK